MRHKMRIDLFLIVIGLSLIIGCESGVQIANRPPVDTWTGQMVEWKEYASDLAGAKYAAVDQINAENVDKVEIAWRWQSPDNPVNVNPLPAKPFIYQATPIMVEGILYICTSLSQVSAINAENGKTIWNHDPKSYKSGRVPSHFTFVNRGVVWWRSGEDRRILLGTSDARLIALNADTGEPVEGFGDNGSVDLTKGLRRPVDPDKYSVTSPPIIVGDVVVVGSSITDYGPTKETSPGDVRGFDVRTGEQLWVFKTVPQEGEFGNETWENESWRYTGQTNVWTMMSADPELGYVYLPVSTPTNDWYGGHRPGDNLFAESLVCLNAKTGERVWHYQIVHHGIWDYDLPAAPNLVDIEVDGRAIKAVAQVTKMGFVFVFDRVTGEPVWPIEERPVAASNTPGEKASPTQPFPTKPAPFERQGVVAENLIDFTPELRQEAEKTIENFDMGPLYTPPTTRGLIYLPGALGGANWHGAAFDPETDVLYVPSITHPTAIRLEPPGPGSDVVYWHRYLYSVSPSGLPLFKPPYGRITAIDLKTGDHLWMVPLGEGPRDHPLLKDLNLPRLGWPSRGAALVTKSLLFIGQEGKIWNLVLPLVGRPSPPSAEEQMQAANHDPKFFAYDKKTGELIWEIELPANVTGAPMTYMCNGKQYIAFTIGGLGAPAELIALSLP